MTNAKMALSLSVSINRHRNSIVDISFGDIGEKMEAFGCDEATVIIARSQYNMDHLNVMDLIKYLL